MDEPLGTERFFGLHDPKSRTICLLFFLVPVCFNAFPARAETNPSDPNWGCYDAEPGHPTSSEITSFFSQVSVYAKAAEKQDGVPAAGITAMSMQESGYGFTRTALYANNLFGWKASEGDPTAYVLTCQQSSDPKGKNYDPNNYYRRFNDWASAFEAIASRLGLQGATKYAAVTRAYQAERAASASISQSVADWVKGIQQAGYNPNPGYTEQILEVANNYRSPNKTISPEFNLYELSDPAPPVDAKIVPQDDPPQPQKVSQTPQAILEYAEGLINPYQSTSCEPPQLNYPGWVGFPVERCTYTDIGATVHTYMLNADRNKLAHWVLTACEDAHSKDTDHCIAWLTGEMREAASYSIFPVAGYIPEPEYGGLCFLFRDGVTVKSTLRPLHFSKPLNGTCGSDDAENALPLTWAGLYARVASTTREEYLAVHPDASVTGVQWVDVVRVEYQKAWNSDRNELLSAKATYAVLNHLIS